MRYPAEGLLNRIIKAGCQWNRVTALIVRTGIMVVVSLVTAAAFPLPTFAANCTECGHEVDANQLCHNPSCPDSVILCINPVTNTPAYLTPAVITLQPGFTYPALPFVGATTSEPNTFDHDDREAPPWLLNLSRQLARNEDNRPNIGELLSPHNVLPPQLSFNSVDEAITALNSLLAGRCQHFVISYYFPSGVEVLEFHLAVAIDRSGTVFVLSNRAPPWIGNNPAGNSAQPEWRYATQTDRNNIIIALGLDSGGFIPAEETMVVNDLAFMPRELVKSVEGKPAKKKLEVIPEEDENNLTD
ncbi:hypothetical protein [Endozoicomonas euniceicola]|uniref:Uncharacterized protein n=1 Tax=Endozoicomonas euniceicola TaxID=1234143 RepID=A0ABY6GX09_9GAMM|nr:hypothetical protein [Endozoicomonas euniceicola]UYM17318.1 hypothetical protein NX720_05175 [Endozoicomonas euniceicola]